jgi:hypothetical protein
VRKKERKKETDKHVKRMRRLELVLSLVFVILTELSSIWAGQHQKRLLEKLFKNYDASERPVYDETQPLNVSVGMSLQQIVDVDEKKQTIIFSGWLDLVIAVCLFFNSF